MCVIEKVVRKGYCCGCGCCAGICPKNNLNIEWNSNGEYSPKKIGECNKSCSLCEKICPAIDSNPIDAIGEKIFSNIEGINKNANLGYYIENFLGYVSNNTERVASASGGMTTWVLEKLLQNKLVDKIVTVKSTNKTDRYFDFVEVDNAQSLKECRGSSYYPVEISNAIRNILSDKEDNRYAIVALPCVVLGIRKAMDVMPKLKRRIKFILSLTCGQLPNKYYTEYIARKSGLEPDEIKAFNYREKKENGKANEYFQVATDFNNKKRDKYIYMSLHNIWKYRCFTYRACSYCDDLFGELADATFMDAWLPENIEDWRGTSIVITRNKELAQIIYEGIENEECSIKTLSEDKVKESQAFKVYDKKVLIKGRLYYADKKGLEIPSRRVEKDKKIYKQNKRFNKVSYYLEKTSKEAWLQYTKDKDYKKLQEEFAQIEKKVKTNEFIDRVNNKLYRVKRRLLKSK